MKVQFQIETTLEIDDEMEVPKEVIAEGYEAVSRYVFAQVQANGSAGLNIVGERLDEGSTNIYGKVLKHKAFRPEAGGDQ